MDGAVSLSSARNGPPPSGHALCPGVKEWKLPMREEGFRGFVAIALPDEIRSRCARLLATLRGGARQVSWVKPENLHLTMKFLGNTRPSQAERLLASLAHKAMKLSPFEIAFGGLGAFPTLRRPRIIWVGVSEGAGSLEDLAAKVEGAAAKAGFSRESRRFSPHLTLGRVKIARRRSGTPSAQTVSEKRVSEDLQTLLARADPGPLGRFTVREMVLIESRLSPEGAVYTPLARVKLGREPGRATAREER